MSIRETSNRFRRASEEGQAIIIFAVALVILIGFVGLSVDVGRYMWAKSEMQASVDASALAGAQSMPNGSAEAETFANQFWDSNKATILQQGENVTFGVTFPGGHRAVRVEATAEIPTYFVRFFGVDHWDVSAVGKAESQVLDIALVLDVSGSMCFNSYPPVEGTGGPNSTYPWRGVVMGPGQNPPKLSEAIAANTNNSITIKLYDASMFTTKNTTTKSNFFGSYYAGNNNNVYHEISGNNSRTGMIMIGTEIFKITGVGSDNKTLTVTRAQPRYDSGVSVATPKVAHLKDAEIWTNKSVNGSRGYCDMAARGAAGPYEPFHGSSENAKYFIDLFNAQYDKIGVAHYSTVATVDKGLTGTSGTTYASLKSAINGFSYPDGGTNIADGIAKGRSIINGAGKRPNGVKILVILTDGVPTQYCRTSGSGDPASTSPNYGQTGCVAQNSDNINTCTTTTAVTHAKHQAAVAKSQGMIVYTIGLGNAAIDCILQDIAAQGGGEYFKAPTTAQLDDAFRAIALRTHIGLTD